MQESDGTSQLPTKTTDGANLITGTPEGDQPKTTGAAKTSNTGTKQPEAYNLVHALFILLVVALVGGGLWFLGAGRFFGRLFSGKGPGKYGRLDDEEK